MDPVAFEALQLSCDIFWGRGAEDEGLVWGSKRR